MVPKCSELFLLHFWLVNILLSLTKGALDASTFFHLQQSIGKPVGTSISLKAIALAQTIADLGAPGSLNQDRSGRALVAFCTFCFLHIGRALVGAHTTPFGYNLTLHTDPPEAPSGNGSESALEPPGIRCAIVMSQIESQTSLLDAIYSLHSSFSFHLFWFATQTAGAPELGGLISDELYQLESLFFSKQLIKQYTLDVQPCLVEKLTP